MFFTKNMIFNKVKKKKKKNCAGFGRITVESTYLYKIKNACPFYFLIL